MKKILALFLVFVLIFGCISPKSDQDETKNLESNQSGDSMENKSDGSSMDDKQDTTMNDSPEDLSGVTVGDEGQEVTADEVPEVEDDKEFDEMLNEFQ